MMIEILVRVDCKGHFAPIFHTMTTFKNGDFISAEFVAEENIYYVAVIHLATVLPPSSRDPPCFELSSLWQTKGLASHTPSNS